MSGSNLTTYKPSHFEATECRENGYRREEDAFHAQVYEYKIELMVRTLWEILNKMGVTSDEIVSKMDEIQARNMSLEPVDNIVLCPSCGKKIKESSHIPFEGTCIFCGTTVPIYPGDSIE